MNKEKELEEAKLVLSPSEYKKYEEWLDKPFREKYPDLWKILPSFLALLVSIVALIVSLVKP